MLANMTTLHPSDDKAPYPVRGGKTTHCTDDFFSEWVRRKLVSTDQESNRHWANRFTDHGT